MSALAKGVAAQLRPMREADLPEIMAIEKRAYRQPWTVGIFRDCMRVGYCCWVLEEDGEVVGYGVMSVAAGESHILNLCVRPETQGQGLGRRMMSHLLRLARHHGAGTAFLEVRPSNTVALRLYCSLGFNEIGMRKDYYPSAKGREDALVLAREL